MLPRRLSLPALFASVLLCTARLLGTAPDPKIVSNDTIATEAMSAAEMDRVTSAGPKYDFTIVNASTVAAPTGQKVALRDLKKHLKKGKYDKKAFAILWLEADTEMPAPPEMEAILKAFGSYGITNFALRRRDASPGGANVTAKDAKKIVVLVGKPNSKSLTAKDPLPDFAGRPAALRPEKLPPRVRYVVSPDEEVIAAAALANARLLDIAPGDGSLFGDFLFVGAGAWQYFRNEPDIGHKGSTPFSGQVPMGKKVAVLEGRILRDAGEIRTLERKLRALIQEDGGGKVRALHSREMDKWWTFITLDIEEPVFVLESRGGRYLFIFSFEKKGVLQLDELHGLPNG